MTDIRLRALQRGDAAAITALFNLPKVIDGTLRLPFTPEEGVEGWLGGVGRDDRMVVAEAAGVAIGFILLTRRRGRMAHCGDLFIAVHDERQGRGVGGALMDAAIDIADNWMGLRRLQLEVLVDNEPAVRLYAARGFEVEGRGRAGTLRGGLLVDHFYMARLAPPPARRPEDAEEAP